MQHHLHRNELWLFLKGDGYLMKGKKKCIVKKGDYVYIPKEKGHQYFPLTKTTVLEIQFGDKCEEGDIVRT